MTPRENPTRAGLQVALEADGPFLIRELNHDVKAPVGEMPCVGSVLGCDRHIGRSHQM